MSYQWIAQPLHNAVMGRKSWLLRAVWMVPLALTVLLGLVVLAAAWLSRAPLSGTHRLPGAQAPVKVVFDEADVPHIQASNEADAWRAMGWLHAAERPWQMAFQRRVVRGELSALLGPATLDADKLLRTLGIARAAKRQLAQLNPASQTALQAYADGVNAYFARPEGWLGPEFWLLGERPQALAAKGEFWQPSDSVGWALMMALDLGGNWSHELARMTAASKLSTREIWQLMPPYPGDAPATRADFAQWYDGLGVFDRRAAMAQNSPAPADHWRGAVAQAVTDWVQSLGQQSGLGSNNWALSGSRTESGRPLLANDPHLSLGAPALWYVAHVQGGAVNAVGATLPGLPFVVLGRTATAAWGFTNTNPDVQDLYLEQLNPFNGNQYRIPSANGQLQWQSFTVRRERIEIKGQDAVILAVRESRHGPVISDVDKAFDAMPLDKTRFAVALRWAALDEDNTTIDAGFAVNRAHSVDDLIQAYASYHSPMQNVVMADAAGRIAYRAVGRAPIRRSNNDLMGVAPAPGWDPRYDWAGWLKPSQLPSDDGAKGWVGTANQRVTAKADAPFLTADWSQPWRMQRIGQLIGLTPLHTMQSMQAMQRDTLSMEAMQWLPLMLSAAGQHPLTEPVKTLLRDFKGSMAMNQPQPLILAAWLDEVTRRLLTPKLGDERVAVLYGKRTFREGVLNILRADDANWCGQGGCVALAGDAMDAALTRLSATYGNDPSQWRWGQAHHAISEHRPFGAVAALRWLFNLEVKSPGGPHTINVGTYEPNRPHAPFASRKAPSYRAVYDLADPEHSVFIYSTGQSGNVFERRYRDMAEQWAAGQYRPLRMAVGRVTRSLVMAPEEVSPSRPD